MFAHLHIAWLWLYEKEHKERTERKNRKKEQRMNREEKERKVWLYCILFHTSFILFIFVIVGVCVL